MSFRDFFHGGGEIVLHDRFLSLRIVKANLERKFGIRVMEESSTYFKCQIVRFWGWHGTLSIFMSPTLELLFKNEREESVIEYTFTCYNYYVLPIMVIMVGIGSLLSWGGSGRTFLIFPAMVFGIFGTVIFLDTKFLVYRIRRNLSKIS